MATVTSVALYALAAGVAYVLLRLCAEPARVVLALGIRAVVGAAVLWLGNRIGDTFGVTVGLNPVTALVAGFLGVPGVVVLFVLAYFVLS